MQEKKYVLNTVLYAILITTLFYKQYWGLNVLIAEVVLVCWLKFTNQFSFKNFHEKWIGFSLLLTGIFTVIVHSNFVYIMNFISLFLFTGVLIYTMLKSLVSVIRLAFFNLILSQKEFLATINNSNFKGRKLMVYLWKSRIYTVPIFIILLFVVLYKNANPVFDQLLQKLSNSIGPWLNALLNKIDLFVLPFFLLCLLISNLYFFKKAKIEIVQADENASNELLRSRKKSSSGFNLIGLKYEYKAGVFLFVILNLILAVVNTIDVYWVWFNFEWKGQYLKQFVHDGTYLLIASLIISILLVLYFFRRNLNFYYSNTLLKQLAILWLAQNALLAISVAIRNFRYIEYFALAYKRIGVIIFLMAVIYGLYIIYLKINKRQSSYYLIRKNTAFVYWLLVISSLLNWDSIIAKYNFNHYQTAFLHLEYLTTLSDKTLPILNKSEEELKRIQHVQLEKFPFDGKAMDVVDYRSKIESKKIRFISKWENKNWLSWNYAEYSAFEDIKKKN